MLSESAVRVLRGAFKAVHWRPSGSADAIRRTDRSWHRVPLPNTWFIILRSHELPRGRVRAVQLAGRDLVAFRGHDGTVGVLDAFCPHLGADLRDGTVVADRLRCPFHGLEWTASGSCANLSSLTSIDHVTTATSYPVVERNNSIHVWIDEQGRAPTWEPPAFESDLVEFSRAREPVNCHLVVESMACFDAEHGQHSHSTIFDGLRFETVPGMNRVITDDSAPHQLGVEVALRHRRLSLAMKVAATFYGPAICSAGLAFRIGRARRYTTLQARTYTGLTAVDHDSHVADNAVYIRAAAPLSHRPLAVALSFWVHTVMHHDDVLVWDHLNFNRGGSYYAPFWNWYDRFLANAA